MSNRDLEVRHLAGSGDLGARGAATIEELLRQLVLHADETSLQVDGKNHWIHIYGGGDITIKCLRRKGAAMRSKTSASSAAVASS